MMGVKQDNINYHFLSLWYDSTWDWTQISRTIGEHSNHYTNYSKKIVYVSSSNSTSKNLFTLI